MEEESVYREHEMSFATESDFFDDQLSRHQSVGFKSKRESITSRPQRESFYQNDMLLDEKLLCTNCLQKVKEVQNGLKKTHHDSMIQETGFSLRPSLSVADFTTTKRKEVDVENFIRERKSFLDERELYRSSTETDEKFIKNKQGLLTSKSMKEESKTTRYNSEIERPKKEVKLP